MRIPYLILRCYPNQIHGFLVIDVVKLLIRDYFFYLYWIYILVSVFLGTILSIQHMTRRSLCN